MRKLVSRLRNSIAIVSEATAPISALGGRRVNPPQAGWRGEATKKAGPSRRNPTGRWGLRPNPLSLVVADVPTSTPPRFATSARKPHRRLLCYFGDGTLGILWISLLMAAIPLAARQQNQDSAWEQTRHIAEAQHEIIALAIRQNNFSQVLPEMRKIFQLKFPQKHESTLSQEIDMVADALMHKEQYDLAHQCIDEGLKSLTVNQNKSRVLKRKAYILEKQGKEGEALKYFKQAVDLAKNSTK